MTRDEINYAAFDSKFIPQKSAEERKREIEERRQKLRAEDHELFIKAQRYRKNLKSGKYVSPRRRKMLEEMKKEKEANDKFFTR